MGDSIARKLKKVQFIKSSGFYFQNKNIKSDEVKNETCQNS